MAEIISFRDGPHESIEMLLPWYATGQLGHDEAAAVEAHLSGCGQCLAAMERETRMKAQVAQLPINADLGWEKLQRRLAPDLRADRRRPAPRARRWAMTAWPALLTAFAGTQAAMLAVAVLLLRPVSVEPGYHTLGSPGTPEGNLIILFRPDTTEEQLRLTLGRAGARLVDGPTAAGAYILKVEPGRRDATVAQLRAQSHIMLAQPIDPGSAQ